jgi:deoxycytidine triphosphate deaminase
MKFTNDIFEKLLAIPTNEYLKKTADEKYEDWGKKDPFPHIANALLNSKDIAKYILITGLIDPFVPENLTGASYTCNFSGTYTYWDGKDEQHKKTLQCNEDLVLHPNSITYLEIAQKFRVPEYMVLRFNLQVQNVYKGLLLGTGPIVDPGFVGNLFIPLHNLTSNEYKIKSNASLISIEFTKLSVNKEWVLSNTTNPMKMINALDFTIVPYVSGIIKSNRLLDEYIKKALQDNPDFRKSDDKIIVNSSMRKLLSQVEDEREQITNAINDNKKVQEEINKKQEKAESRETFFKWVSIWTIVALLLSVGGMVIGAWSYFKNARELSDANQLIILQKQENLEKEKSLFEQIELLQTELEVEKITNVMQETQLTELIRQLEVLRNIKGNHSNSP